MHPKLIPLAKDSIHGASFLLREAADILLRHCQELDELQRLLHDLPKTQPWMAPLFNLAKYVQESPKPCMAIEEFLAKETKEKEALIQRACQLIKDGERILTHSHSSLVKEVLLQKRVEVFVTESRPKKEGVALYHILRKAGIEATLVTDAAAAYLVRKCDRVLLGADGIGDFGLVHKIGTYPIALAAKEAGIEVDVLATSARFWPKEFVLPPQPRKPCDEIAPSIRCLNYYFDITPNFLYQLL